MVLQRTRYWLSEVCLLAINKKDMFRNVYCLSDFLCKSLLKPSAWKRYWQRQHKEYVETWGQAWDITRVIQRHCKDNKKTKRTNEDKPRTSRGQKKDLQRAAPTESTTLPNNVSHGFTNVISTNIILSITLKHLVENAWMRLSFGVWNQMLVLSKIIQIHVLWRWIFK